MATKEVKEDTKLEGPPTTGKDMAKGICAFWEKGLLVDYTIKVEDRSFHVHKVVVASMSDYFEAMLTGSMLESRKDSVELKGVNADAVEILIRYIYKKQLNITKVNVVEVLGAATYLQMQSAIDICAKFMYGNLDVDNCLDFLSSCRTYNLVEALEFIKRFVMWNVRRIVMKHDITQLPHEDLCLLIDDWESSEWNLFFIIKDWIETDRENRHKHLDELMKRVHYALMRPTELASIKKMEIYSQPPNSWCELVEKAQKYHELPMHQKALDPSDQVKVRREPALMALSADQAVPGAFLYETLESSKLIKHNGLKLPKGKWKVYSQIEMNNFLVLCMRLDDRNLSFQDQQWFMFDPRSLQWSEIEALDHFDEGALTHDDKYIYAIGGTLAAYDDEYYSPCVNRYDLHTNKWESMTEMPVQIKNHAACVYGGSLYVSGGQENKYPGLNEVYCLDLAAQTWQSKAPSLKSHCFHAIVVLMVQGEEVLFIIENSFEDFEYYSPSKDEWTKCTYTFSCPPPTWKNSSKMIVRGSTAFFIDIDHKPTWRKDQNEFAIVEVPTKGTEIDVRYCYKYKGRLGKHTPLYFTALSLSPAMYLAKGCLNSGQPDTKQAGHAN